MPGRSVPPGSCWINYRPWWDATVGTWCMVREANLAARKARHGNEFSGVRTTHGGTRGEDRGAQVPGFGFERQHLGRDQAIADEEPGADQQHLLESLALADHPAGAPSAAALHARLRLHD